MGKPYSIFLIEKHFNPLRKLMRETARTYVTRYRWCKNLTLDESKSLYLKEVANKIPAAWVDKFIDIRAKLHHKYGDTWFVEFIFNVPEEAGKQFEIAWSDVGPKPHWVHQFV